jgi:hypothetical protein
MADAGADNCSQSMSAPTTTDAPRRFIAIVSVTQSDVPVTDR